jgi:RHS repeat-associated protein
LTLTQTGPAGALNYAYTYDQADNRVSMTDTAGTHTFGYNKRDYLTAAMHPTASNPAESFSYDAVGNRLTSHLSAAYTYDTANRETADATFDYTYDADGNLITRKNKTNNNVRTYAYDAENRLTKITFPDATVTTYRYDPLGRRFEKNVSGQITRYVYAGSTILKELDASGATTARYTPGVQWDEMLAVRRGGTTSVFETDAMGSVIRVGTTTYEYDSFGRITTQTGTPPATFAFQGREFDAESRLYYFRARYYDPVAGRFLTEDPIGFGGGLNLYAFVENNSVNRTDPEGLDGFSCMKPLHALGGQGRRSGPDIWGNPLYHQYLCVQIGGKMVCGGQDRRGNPFWSAGRPSNDTYSEPNCDPFPTTPAQDQCVADRFKGGRPQYGLLGPGTNCQEWAREVLHQCTGQ